MGKTIHRGAVASGAIPAATKNCLPIPEGTTGRLKGAVRPSAEAGEGQGRKPSLDEMGPGVESAPGVKDPELIRRFLKAAKAAKHV